MCMHLPRPIASPASGQRPSSLGAISSVAGHSRRDSGPEAWRLEHLPKRLFDRIGALGFVALLCNRLRGAGVWENGLLVGSSLSAAVLGLWTFGGEVGWKDGWDVCRRGLDGLWGERCLVDR